MTKARVKIMICYINHDIASYNVLMNLWCLERKIAWVDIVVTRLGGTGLSITNKAYSLRYLFCIFFLVC